MIKKLLALVFLLGVTGVGSARAVDLRPNIIFLLTDDQSTYSLGCYGNKDVKTPNIDSLSDDGITFDHHYNTTAICMASRANIMTGMYEYRTGCNFSGGPMQKAHWGQSYPMLLRKAGYVTAFAGKFGFVVDGQGLPETDFDRWGGGPGQTSYDTRKNKSMAKYAEKYPHASRSYGAFGGDFVKESAKGDRPFCLSISFKAPHRPVTPDPEYVDVYKGVVFTKPDNYGRQKGEHFSKQSQQGRQYERFISWGYKDNYDQVMAAYHAQIYGVDVAVGMIREAVKDAGVADNTVIIFTSDNGFFCGSHGYGSKVLPYEESASVPLIILDPRHKNSGKHLRSGALTANIDFAPTIMRLAGLDAPANIDGKSLLPLLDDAGAVIHESIKLINVWGTKETHSYSVVTKDHKYINWPWAGQGFEATEELYNLTKDKLELSNLAVNPEHEKTLNAMRKHYDQAVVDWREGVLDSNTYKSYGDNFDREYNWAENNGDQKKKPKRQNPSKR